jgi:hypothetical protein
VYTRYDFIQPTWKTGCWRAPDMEGVRRALQKGKNLQNTEQLDENYQVSGFRAVHRLVDNYIKTS